MPAHIALLGDSIFDNGAYVQGEADVIGHLRAVIPSQWQATLCAIDGSMAADLELQITTIPEDVSHLVISIGGNNALMNSDLLALPVGSTTEALALFGERASAFERAYRKAIGAALALERDTTICTIYEGNLPAAEAHLARVALMPFNDAILRVAFEHRLRVIDLRSVCNQPEDYANPIEPSGSGGRKIAEAIVRALGIADGDFPHSSVFGGDNTY